MTECHQERKLSPQKSARGLHLVCGQCLAAFQAERVLSLCFCYLGRFSKWPHDGSLGSGTNKLNHESKGNTEEKFYL